MAQIPPMGEWRFARMGYGAQCVPVSGITMTPESCVNNSDSTLKVFVVYTILFCCYVMTFD